MTNRDRHREAPEVAATDLDQVDRDSMAEVTDDALSAELETLAAELRQPRPTDSYASEAACRSAILKAYAAIDGAAGGNQDEALERPRAIPEQVGPYRILALLGRGGMGSVYQALHTRLDKVVALKTLDSRQLSSRELVARFEREMKAVGKLEHPHLIRAYDAGEADGLHYLAMEFVDGVDLDALIRKRGPLPVHSACELVIQAAAGLQAAHSRGMVHRDIKPANLMLARQEFGPPLVKVLDLGLARLAEMQVMEEGNGLTTSGQVMGTVDFMALEQATDSHTVDIRADIYSLGATLYALLTGGSILQDRPRLTLLQKLMVLASETPVPIRNRRPDISDSLASVVHRMLARRPEDRYATPAEVVDALRPFAAGADLQTLIDDMPRSANRGDPGLDNETRILSPRSEERPGPHRADSGRSAASAGSRRGILFGAATAAGTGLLAAIVMLLRTPHGNVEVHMPEDVPLAIRQQIQIRVLGDGTAQVANAANGWRIQIKEGKYSVQMTGASDQFELQGQEVTVRRDQQAIVNVVLKKPDLKSPAPAAPVNGLESKERQFVRWLWSHESPPHVEIRFPDGRQDFLPNPMPNSMPVAMPDGDFTISALSWMGMDADRHGDTLLEQTAVRLQGIRLARLGLKSTSVTTDGVIRFLEGIDKSDLWFLGLRGETFSDRIFEALPHCPRLKSLELVCSRKMTGRGFHRLTTVTSLQLLEEQFLTAEGFEELLQLPRLELLQLASRSLGQDRIDVIARLQILTLYVENCAIDDARLARLTENPRLESLYLNRNPITDTGLSSLKKLSRLTQVSLNGTQVTAAGIADLQQALPACKVLWSDSEN